MKGSYLGSEHTDSEIKTQLIKLDAVLECSYEEIILNCKSFV